MALSRDDKLYIPFWLNLYRSGYLHNEFRGRALHSILVKSIPNKIASTTQQTKSLHSILVKSIPEFIRPIIVLDYDFTFHSG